MRASLFVVAVATAIAALCGSPVMSQEAGFEQATSPFQGEFTYRVGEVLQPRVEVDGLRFLQLNVTPKDTNKVESGKASVTFISIELENRREETATSSLVILFEDENGIPLDRLTCDPVRVPGGEVRSDRQRVKLQGDVLLAMQKVYLFLEVSR